jgi:hypothetical protein
VNVRGVDVSEVAARHAAEITATDVSGTEPGPAHASAAETRTAKMRTTEMRPATSEVMTATTATATATAPMTMRQARASSENKRGKRNCRDERFDNSACHRVHSCKRRDCAYSRAKRYYNMRQEMLFPSVRARHQAAPIQIRWLTRTSRLQWNKQQKIGANGGNGPR